MPKKDGIETAKDIRRTVGDDIPIIILSAYDWSHIGKDAMDAGVNAFIEKPLFKSRLTQTLKSVLGDNDRKKKLLLSNLSNSRIFQATGFCW